MRLLNLSLSRPRPPWLHRAFELGELPRNRAGTARSTDFNLARTLRANQGRVLTSYASKDTSESRLTDREVGERRKSGPDSRSQTFFRLLLWAMLTPVNPHSTRSRVGLSFH